MYALACMKCKKRDIFFPSQLWHYFLIVGEIILQMIAWLEIVYYV